MFEVLSDPGDDQQRRSIDQHEIGYRGVFLDRLLVRVRSLGWVQQPIEHPGVLFGSVTNHILQRVGG